MDNYPGLIPKTVNMFTDGACSGNPGPGAYACILQYQGHEKILSDYEPETTNNQMELIAVIKGLEALKYPCIVKVTSDSKYVVDGATSWLKSWKSNNWKQSNKKTIKNLDLWQRLDKLLQIHDVSFIWIKGHNQHFYNEKCDKIATDLIKENQKNNKQATLFDTDNDSKVLCL